MANWADLPFEILNELLTRLGDIEDLIRFGGVCHSWRSACVENKKTKKSLCPWMMLSETEPPQNFLDEETVVLINMFNQEDSNNPVSDENHHGIPRRFYNLSSKKTIEISLQETQGRRCLGSSFGWLFTLGLDLNIHLLNPLTRSQISLPSQPTFQDQYEYYVDPRHLRKVFVHKFAMSSHPYHQDCVVMVIYSQWCKLAIARPRDKAWTTVEGSLGSAGAYGFDDLIFYNDALFAIKGGGRLSVCDITRAVPQVLDIMRPPPRPKHFHMYYLVEISGDLHMVVRIYIRDETVSKDVYLHNTIGFQVHKLDFCQMKWIELHSLEDNALFLGNNGAFALSTSHHPELRPNSIYFTDDYREAYADGSCDMGLFDFEKKVIKSFYIGDGIRTTFCGPLFFVPNLH